MKKKQTSKTKKRGKDQCNQCKCDKYTKPLHYYISRKEALAASITPLSNDYTASFITPTYVQLKKSLPGPAPPMSGHPAWHGEKYVSRMGPSRTHTGTNSC